MASNQAYVSNGDATTTTANSASNPTNPALTAAKSNANSNISSINQQVESVKEIMKDNLNKVLERDVSLHELENRTENLETSANLFQTRAIRARRLFACKSRKWTIIIVICVLVLLGIIGLAIGLSVQKQK